MYPEILFILFKFYPEMHFYGFSIGCIWGKNKFWETSPKQFFGAFMPIWAWKTDLTNLFAGSTICCIVSVHNSYLDSTIY